MEELRSLAGTLFGLELNNTQLEAFAIFERELLDWSERFNLTAIRDPEGIRLKHFLDSLSCARAWESAPPESLIDVGTGAGLPGLALKILYPHLRLTLVESVNKKAGFCRHMIEALGLREVSVVTARAEDAGRLLEHRGRYDWAVARAVASMPVLCEYLLPLVRLGGKILAQKGEAGPEELKQSARALRLLGGRALPPIAISLPGIDEPRWLIVAEKIAHTPDEYPRRAGVPARSPL